MNLVLKESKNKENAEILGFKEDELFKSFYLCVDKNLIEKNVDKNGKLTIVKLGKGHIYLVWGHPFLANFLSKNNSLRYLKIPINKLKDKVYTFPLNGVLREVYSIDLKDELPENAPEFAQNLLFKMLKYNGRYYKYGHNLRKNVQLEALKRIKDNKVNEGKIFNLLLSGAYDSNNLSELIKRINDPEKLRKIMESEEKKGNKKYSPYPEAFDRFKKLKEEYFAKPVVLEKTNKEPAVIVVAGHLCTDGNPLIGTYNYTCYVYVIPGFTTIEEGIKYKNGGRSFDTLANILADEIKSRKIKKFKIRSDRELVKKEIGPLVVGHSKTVSYAYDSNEYPNIYLDVLEIKKLEDEIVEIVKGKK